MVVNQAKTLTNRYAPDGRLPHGRLKTITYPNGIIGFRTYYPDTGLLKSAGYKRANGTLIYSDQFDYVLGSNLYKSVTRATSTDKKTTHYQYDDYQRLTRVTEPNGRRTAYEYDAFGNRLKETVTNIKDPAATAAQGQKPYGVYSYVYTDKSNRLEHVKFNGVVLEEYTYDNAGQMDIRTRYEGANVLVTDYDFNALGKLTKVTLPDNTEIEYTYDALGVRKTKTVNGTLDTQYLSANIFGLPHVLMELDAGLGIKSSYVYAGGQQLKEEPDAAQRAQDLYKLHNGMVGSITHEVNPNGVIENEYEYDAFGARTGLKTAGGHQHYGYTGEEYDAETGLLYLRARYYDPNLGRFISADPYLGRLAEPVTQNRFIYVHNNPLRFVDPTGNSIGWAVVPGVVIGGGLILYYYSGEEIGRPAHEEYNEIKYNYDQYIVNGVDEKVIQQQLVEANKKAQGWRELGSATGSLVSSAPSGGKVTDIAPGAGLNLWNEAVEEIDRLWEEWSGNCD